jgi:hypothetical protein
VWSERAAHDPRLLGSPRFCRVIRQSEHRFQNIVQLLFVWIRRFEFEVGLQVLSFRPMLASFRVNARQCHIRWFDPLPSSKRAARAFYSVS